MTICYVCTKTAALRVREIPFCADHAPKPERVKPQPPPPPAPRPTPLMTQSARCPVYQGGFCGHTCEEHGCDVEGAPCLC